MTIIFDNFLIIIIIKKAYSHFIKWKKHTVTSLNELFILKNDTKYKWNSCLYNLIKKLH